MSKILVTGGAGFIGSHVTKLLEDGDHQVTVYDDLSSGHRKSLSRHTKFISGDIQDKKKLKEALKGVEAVIHMAGLIIVPESVKDPIKYCNVNVLGSVNLLEAMKEAGVKKIVFSSSACVYGAPDKLPLTEDAPIRPDNPYGASKASVETFLQAFNSDFGFDAIVLRYFNPYGPGELHVPETHAIPNFIKAAIAKKPIPLYWDGEQIRDFIYIDDLAQAHVDVLSQTGYQVFNVGTEKGIKVKDVLAEIENIMGNEISINNLGERLGDVQANYASSTKLKAATGWKAKVTLADGLKKTVEYYKNYSS